MHGEPLLGTKCEIYILITYINYKCSFPVVAQLVVAGGGSIASC